jgi:hypothetical protein
MDLKFQNKNKIGIISALFLIILLTQDKTCNFLFYTILGRLILIILILSISTFNILLGIVYVLFTIALINENNGVYLEGFQDSTDYTNIDNSNVVANASAAASTHYNTIGGKGKGGIEGFNIIERERNIQKGKRSNEVPVSKSTSDDIEPSNKLIFTDNYSSV